VIRERRFDEKALDGRKGPTVGCRMEVLKGREKSPSYEKKRGK